MHPFRIVTYNIAHGRGLSPYQGLNTHGSIRRNVLKIAHLLAELKPDVVALQEIDEDSHWNGRLNLLEYLREHSKIPYGVMGINSQRSGLKPLRYGNAVLSRHPIVAWENVSFGRSEIGGKGFIFAEMDIGRRHVVPIVNLHLAFESRRARLQQAEAVSDYLHAKYNHRHGEWLVPPILCGDLNNSSRGPDATAALYDYFQRHGEYTLHPANGRTFPSPLPSRTLDFVFLPPACRLPVSTILRSYLSDHRPVIVDFRLPGTRTH
ncbi:MAG TPA: endonuclease/exonuclease/phosphatase family protein [Opitutaceae bacterium]|nr:endonuclease/exonuclease/phosphatase family protein [Opitutaceae bacterium]